MTDTELAWAAGFFDGEGCITLSRNIPVISIAQVDREVLDRFQLAVGVGKVGGPYTCYKYQPQYKYQLSRIDDVREVFQKLSPYLSSLKKEKAKKLINQTSHIKGRKRR